mmetsp:Transcript_6089/g.13315  ORF Transcript_6089/g.13315 Transcript_6089/m.13315 type:complete len:230 (-) Transcript_6089:343-1032(-)
MSVVVMPSYAPWGGANDPHRYSCTHSRAANTSAGVIYGPPSSQYPIGYHMAPNQYQLQQRPYEIKTIQNRYSHQALAQERQENDERDAVSALLCLVGSAPPAPLSHPQIAYAQPMPMPPAMPVRRPIMPGAFGFPLSGWDSGSSASSSPKVMRRSIYKDGAPPPGSCRFQCRHPGCSKVYASTDAVRKHCRKRHMEWLRRLDKIASRERQMPKPALYCRWSNIDDVSST